MEFSPSSSRESMLLGGPELVRHVKHHECGTAKIVSTGRDTKAYYRRMEHFLLSLVSHPAVGNEHGSAWFDTNTHSKKITTVFRVFT